MGTPGAGILSYWNEVLTYPYRLHSPFAARPLRGFRAAFFDALS